MGRFWRYRGKNKKRRDAARKRRNRRRREKKLYEATLKSVSQFQNETSKESLEILQPMGNPKSPRGEKPFKSSSVANKAKSGKKAKKWNKNFASTSSTNEYSKINDNEGYTSETSNNTVRPTSSSCVNIPTNQNYPNRNQEKRKAKNMKPSPNTTSKESLQVPQSTDTTKSPTEENLSESSPVANKTQLGTRVRDKTKPCESTSSVIKFSTIKKVRPSGTSCSTDEPTSSLSKSLSTNQNYSNRDKESLKARTEEPSLATSETPNAISKEALQIPISLDNPRSPREVKPSEHSPIVIRTQSGTGARKKAKHSECTSSTIDHSNFNEIPLPGTSCSTNKPTSSCIDLASNQHHPNRNRKSAKSKNEESHLETSESPVSTPKESLQIPLSMNNPRSPREEKLSKSSQVSNRTHANTGTRKKTKESSSTFSMAEYSKNIAGLPFETLFSTEEPTSSSCMNIPSNKNNSNRNKEKRKLRFVEPFPNAIFKESPQIPQSTDTPKSPTEEKFSESSPVANITHSGTGARKKTKSFESTSSTINYSNVNEARPSGASCTTDKPTSSSCVNLPTNQNYSNRNKSRKVKNEKPSLETSESPNATTKESSQIPKSVDTYRSPKEENPSESSPVVKNPQSSTGARKKTKKSAPPESTTEYLNIKVLSSETSCGIDKKMSPSFVNLPINQNYSDRIKERRKANHEGPSLATSESLNDTPKESLQISQSMDTPRSPRRKVASEGARITDTDTPPNDNSITVANQFGINVSDDDGNINQNVDMVDTNRVDLNQAVEANETDSPNEDIEDNFVFVNENEADNPDEDVDGFVFVNENEADNPDEGIDGFVFVNENEAGAPNEDIDEGFEFVHLNEANGPNEYIDIDLVVNNEDIEDDWELINLMGDDSDEGFFGN